MRKLSVILAGVLAVPLLCTNSLADDGTNASEAAQLFSDGRRLMATGDYAAACQKLAESLALDQQADTALDLSICYRRASQQALRVARELAPPAAGNQADGMSEGSASGASEPAGQGQRVAGLVMGGAGIAGIVAGVIAGITAKNKRDELNSNCAGGQCFAATAQQVQSAHDWAVAADVSLVAGLATLGAGAIVFFTAPKDRPATTPTVGVAPGARGAGVFLRAAF